MLRKLFTIMTLIAFLVSPLWAFDKQPAKFPELESSPVGYSLTQSLVTIYTIGTGLGSMPDLNATDRTKPNLKWQQGRFGMKGSGFVVRAESGKLYVVTAAHCVEPSRVEITSTSANFTMITKCYKVINRLILIGTADEQKVSATIAWLDLEHDMAVLELDAPSEYLKALAYPVSYTYDPNDPVTTLQEGDAIAIIVHKRNEDGSFRWEYEVRTGTITTPGVFCPDVKGLPWFNPHDVTTQPIGIPGDSGSPVFAFKNGKPVIIGVFRALYQGDDTCLGYFVRIDVMKRALDTQ